MCMAEARASVDLDIARVKTLVGVVDDMLAALDPPEGQEKRFGDIVNLVMVLMDEVDRLDRDYETAERLRIKEQFPA